MPTSVRRASLCVSLAVLALGAVATSAVAEPLVGTEPTCPDQGLSQPFTPWADLASYTPQPGGSFEAAPLGWELDGGAGVVPGNEPFMVSGVDRRSLALPPGSAATTSPICVALEHPTMRFFARRADGAADSTLGVEVLFTSPLGEVQTLSIGRVSGTGAWAPSLPFAVLGNLVGTLPGGGTAVRFRFTPTDDAKWQIDDVFVDPWHSR